MDRMWSLGTLGTLGKDDSSAAAVTAAANALKLRHDIIVCREVSVVTVRMFIHSFYTCARMRHARTCTKKEF